MLVPISLSQQLRIGGIPPPQKKTPCFRFERVKSIILEHMIMSYMACEHFAEFEMGLRVVILVTMIITNNDN